MPIFIVISFLWLAFIFGLALFCFVGMAIYIGAKILGAGQ